MLDQSKRRNRIDAKPDAKLLNMLKSGNQSALQIALSNPTSEALAAIEETIALYSGNANPTFYRLGGQRVYTQNSTQSAKEEITSLALNDLLLSDPAYTQSLIASLGAAPNLSNLIMHQLAAQPQKLYDYQLLGVQMQLAHLLSKNNISSAQNMHTASKENTNSPREDLEVLFLDGYIKTAETATKIQLAEMLAELTRKTNTCPYSSAIQQKTNETLIAVNQIAKKRFPKINDFSEVIKKDRQRRYAELQSRYSLTNKPTVNKKTAVAFTYVVGILIIMQNIIGIIIVLSYTGLNMFSALGYMLVPILLSFIPLACAFIANKNLKTAGIILLIWGGIRMFGAISSITQGYIFSIGSILLTVVPVILIITSGILCLLANKKGY